jgi:hypothetical protein
MKTQKIDYDLGNFTRNETHSIIAEIIKEAKKQKLTAKILNDISKENVISEILKEYGV